MSMPYFDDFGHDRELMRERGDLVIGRHVIRTGIDLMNLAMDSAMETQRLVGERDALRVEVRDANTRTADQQVARTSAESEVRRLKDRLERAIENQDEYRDDLSQLRRNVTELADAYRKADSKSTPNVTVADRIDGLLAPDEEGDDA